MINKFIHKDINLRKLITKEDKFYFHKIFGFLSILNFFYRYYYCYNSFGNLGYNGKYDSNKKFYFNFFTILFHIMLSSSSLFFRIPKRRLNNKPLIIYEEYRQHAIVFSFRCFSMYIFSIFFYNFSGWIQLLIVFAHHLLVDWITIKHGTPGYTAVRAKEKKLKNKFNKFLAKFFSLYQFFALASHILPNERLSDLSFNALIAIQSSAFMMTLYRKRIITGSCYLLIYTSCLIISYFHIIRLLGLVKSFFVILTFILRISLPRTFYTKYICWTIFFTVVNYLKL